MAIFPKLDLVIGEKARCKRIGKTIHVVHIANDRQIAPTITKTARCFGGLFFEELDLHVRNTMVLVFNDSRSL